MSCPKDPLAGVPHELGSAFPLIMSKALCPLEIFVLGSREYSSTRD